MSRLFSMSGLILLLSACAMDQEASSDLHPRQQAELELPKDCEVFDLEKVFQDPGQFHGKKFCGKAIPNLWTRMDAFHPTAIDDLPQALDTALLLVDVNRFGRAKLDKLKPGDVVTIVGEIEADFCLKSAPKPLVECVPVNHPIFISDPTLYVEHGVSISEVPEP